MKYKCRITYFMCSILLFVLIGSGCSIKEGEIIVDNTKLNNEQKLQESSTSENEATSEVTESEATSEVMESVAMSEEKENEATNEAVEIEDTSEDQVSEEMKKEDEIENKFTWKLLSESVVSTKVSYAGFLDDSLGITAGYAGETSYSQDGGISWSKSDNVSACRYGLDLYDETFIVSSGNSGVNLVSNDKGNSWSPLADFPLKRSGEFNKFISVIDKDNMYIGSSISFGMTKDGGLSWNELEVPENCTKIEGMFFMTPEIGYLMSTDGTLYKTKDACETWTTQAIDLSGEKINASKMPSVAINFQDEDHGVIVYATKTFQLVCIKTEDGGATWESVTLPKVSCFTPYLSRDGQYLTLCSIVKKICLYKLEAE